MPVAGHVTTSGHYHPGRADNCHLCETDTPRNRFALDANGRPISRGDRVQLTGALSRPTTTTAIVSRLTHDRAGSLVHVTLDDGYHTSLLPDKVTIV